MFNNNPDLRGHLEKIEMTPEQIEEYIKCKSDVFYFAKYFYIYTPTGVKPIALRPYQSKVLQVLAAKVDGYNNRIIMQGRQTGKTTIATLYLLWKALFENAKTIAILANKLDQALEIMNRIKESYIRLPMWLQQGIDPLRGGWTRKTIGMDNGSKIFASASSSTAIRGKSANYMLVDEFAFLDQSVAEDFISSVMPVQSSDPNSQVILVSTPNGMNHFADIWLKAVAKENSFIPAKVQWWEVEGHDEAWKAKIIRDFGAKHFAQEYACPNGKSVVRIKRGDTVFDTTLESLWDIMSLEL